MSVIKGLKVDHTQGALVVYLDFKQLKDPDALRMLVNELAGDWSGRLMLELMRGPTYQELVSFRIKRGIRAAKERRETEVRNA
jgi:hypothetical protein